MTASAIMAAGGDSTMDAGFKSRLARKMIAEVMRRYPDDWRDRVMGKQIPAAEIAEIEAAKRRFM